MRLVGRIEAGGGFGGFELRAHVAAQIAVGGFPFALGVAVDQAVQLALQLPGAMTRELLHERPVNPAGFIQRDGKRLGGGLDMLRRLVSLQRAPLEDGGFLRALRFGVVDFKREEEGLIGVRCEGAEIVAGGEGAVSCDKGIVDVVKKFSGLDDAFFRRIFKLGPEHQPHGVAHGHHSSDARGGRSRKAGGLEAVAVADDDCAIALGVGAVLDAGEAHRRRARPAAGRALRPSGCKRPPAEHSTARLQQFRRELAFERRLGAAVHGSFELHFPEHHLGMAGVVFVDRDRPVRAVDRLKPAPGVARVLALRAYACEGTECRW